MTKTKHFLSIAVALTLGACGGSDNDTAVAPGPEPAVNTAPVANSDEASSLNSQAIVIEVLSNDTDAEGNTLSISEITTLPSNGTAEISGSTIEYTANPNYAGMDSLEYTVTDGEFSSTASVNILSTQSMTLLGRVTDGPIPNATVSVILGDDTFSAQADENGDYILEIALESTGAPITIQAQGEGEQAQVELISFLGSTDELLEQRNTDFQLTRETSTGVNVTHVTSASYLLAKEQNELQSFSSQAGFQAALGDVNLQSILDTSGFIKLLVDYQNYSIPEGETSLSVLSIQDTDGVQLDVEKAINMYWAEAGLLDENGNLNAQAQEDLQAAIAETVDDPQVGADFEIADLSGKSLLLVPSAYHYALERRFPSSAQAFVFNDDQTGLNSTESIIGSVQSQTDFTWSISDGELLIDYESMPNESFSTFNYSFVLETFGEDAAEAFAAIYTQEGSAQLRFTRELTSANAKLLNKSELGLNIAFTSSTLLQLYIPAQNGQEQVFNFTDEFTSFGYFVVPSAEASADVEDTEIVGTWALPVYDKFEETGEFKAADTFTRLFHDFITLSEDGTGVTQRGQNPLTWERTDKGFRYTQFNGVTIDIEMVIRDQAEIAIIGRYSSQDISETLFTGTIAKQNLDDLTLDMLSTELPIAWFSTINTHLDQGDAVDNANGIALTRVFAFNVLSDGTMGRISYRDPGIEGELPYFTSDKRRLNWTVNDLNGFIAFESNLDFALRARVWKPVASRNDGDIIQVIESDVNLIDNDRDGIYETSLVVYPRLTSYRKGDLSVYEAVYAESLARGSLD